MHRDNFLTFYVISTDGDIQLITVGILYNLALQYCNVFQGKIIAVIFHKYPKTSSETKGSLNFLSAGVKSVVLANSAWIPWRKINKSRNTNVSVPLQVCVCGSFFAGPPRRSVLTIVMWRQKVYKRRTQVGVGLGVSPPRLFISIRQPLISG